MGVIVPVTLFAVVAMGCLRSRVVHRTVVAAGMCCLGMWAGVGRFFAHLCGHHLAVGQGHRGQHACCHGRTHQATQDQEGDQQQGQGAAHGVNDTAAVGLVP